MKRHQLPIRLSESIADAHRKQRVKLFFSIPANFSCTNIVRNPFIATNSNTNTTT